MLVSKMKIIGGRVVTKDESDPNQSDIEAAQRGNNMIGMSLADLEDLIRLMEGKSTFAAKVTILAAKQMIAAKKRAGARDSKVKDESLDEKIRKMAREKADAPLNDDGTIRTPQQAQLAYEQWYKIIKSRYKNDSRYAAEYTDSKTKDEKIISIATPQWEGDIKIIDGTHFEMKAKGTDRWSWALHIGQADDHILNALKAKGVLKDNGRFFATDSKIKDAKESLDYKGFKITLEQSSDGQEWQYTVYKGTGKIIGGTDFDRQSAKVSAEDEVEAYLKNHPQDSKTKDAVEVVETLQDKNGKWFKIKKAKDDVTGKAVFSVESAEGGLIGTELTLEGARKIVTKDSKTKDTKTATINVQGNDWEVVIMDGTHLKMRLVGTENWAMPLHFNQVRPEFLEALKAKGLVQGNFFMEDSKTKDVNYESKLKELKGKLLEQRTGGATAIEVRNTLGEIQEVENMMRNTPKAVLDRKTKDAVLPNGAIELKRKRTDSDKEIVLAKWDKGGRTEYITWAIYRDDNKSTSHGHYFQSLEEAEKDFMTRDSKTKDAEYRQNPSEREVMIEQEMMQWPMIKLISEAVSEGMGDQEAKQKQRSQLVDFIRSKRNPSRGKDSNDAIDPTKPKNIAAAKNLSVAQGKAATDAMPIKRHLVKTKDDLYFTPESEYKGFRIGYNGDDPERRMWQGWSGELTKAFRAYTKNEIIKMIDDWVNSKGR